MSATPPTTVPVERYIAAIDAAEMLWTVVANVSNSDWQQQSPEWQLAAARWRDNYHTELRRYHALLQTLPVVDANFTAPTDDAPIRSPQDCGAPVAPHPPLITYGVPDVMCEPTTYVQHLLASLARIRNMATASHVPPHQRLDWCANEAVLALDRSTPSGTSADVPGTPPPTP